MTNGKKEGDGRPAHSVEPDEKHRDKGGEGNHEVDPPHERVDDEVGSDEPKKTKRTE